MVYKEIGISHAYTLEASFCGADVGEYADGHVSPRHLEMMGRAVCDTVLDLCDPDPSKVIAVTKELMSQNGGDTNFETLPDVNAVSTDLRRISSDGLSPQTFETNVKQILYTIENSKIHHSIFDNKTTDVVVEDESDCPNEQDNGIKTGDTPEKGKDKGKDGKDKDSKVGKDKKLKKKASRRGSLDALDKNTGYSRYPDDEGAVTDGAELIEKEVTNHRASTTEGKLNAETPPAGAPSNAGGGTQKAKLETALDPAAGARLRNKSKKKTKRSKSQPTNRF